MTGGSNIFKPGTEPASFLIVCFRYIGDVLMTTGLAASIKEALPEAKVDYLVFSGTEGVLDKNPHVGKVFTVAPGGRNLRPLISLFRRYDVALAAYQSDRTIFAAFLAGRRTVGFSYYSRKEWWRSILLKEVIRYNDDVHVVTNLSSLLDPLHIPAVHRVVMGFDASDEDFARKVTPPRPYIVFHPYSRGRYKAWPSRNWRELAALVQEKIGCTVLFTSTPSSEDKAYLEQIIDPPLQGVQVLPLCTFAQLAAVVRGGAVYAGIDTAATHIAAAVGTPVVALYGSSYTRYWGPWPNGATSPSPFHHNRGVQRQFPVTVLQMDWDCVPCNKTSCARSDRGRIECMEAIGPEDVCREIKLLMEQMENV